MSNGHDSSVEPDDAQLTAKLAAAGVGGLLATGVAVAVALSGRATGPDGLIAAARGLMVAVPIAVGIWAWHRRPGDRFGRLLVGLGFGWFLTTLADSGNSVVYSTGRVAGWVVEVGLVYLVLAYPSGRITERLDRALVWTAALLVAVLYVPAVLLMETYPVPSPHTSCTAGCPDNAFFALGSEPGFVDSALRPLRDLLSALLFVAVTARLVHRFRGATHLMQRALEPVLIVAATRTAVVALMLGVRVASPDSAAVASLTWAAALAVPVLAAGFFVGLLSRRLYVANALQDLGRRVRAAVTPDELRDALAEAMGDPTLRVLFPADGGREQWADADGRPVRPPEPGSGQSLTVLREGWRPVAAILHDSALREEQEFLNAVASYALVAVKNQRLTMTVESSLREVSESRARIQASADRERQRIERDLHDGAQQRLVALRVQLELVEELLEHDHEQGLRKLHALGEEVGATLDEIRALAHGVYPSLLEDRGLAEALRAAALRSPIAARVEPDGIGRYSQDVESAVYFCCLEALQNAAKHAGGAKAIVISLRQDEALRFQVRDDGAGFNEAASTPGKGLTNMRDRMVAIGGGLSIRSSERGTVVYGKVPLNPA
jgi:signal transduction histidine kinase